MSTPELTIQVIAIRTKQAAQEALELAKHNGGFLRLHQIEAIAAEPTTRLTPMLVRCGGGRFTCPAQDVIHFITIIEQHAKQNPSASNDYIRDVSLPAGFAVQAVQA